MTSKAVPGATTLHYRYNIAQRLVQMDNGDWHYLYAYNDQGIRTSYVGKYEVDIKAATRYLIDPANPTGYAQVFEELDSAYNTTMTYTIGDDVLTQGTSGGVVRHLGYDGHGSTRLLTDAAGAITNTYNYEAYGTVIGGNPGMRTQPATNLLYAGEYYNPDMQNIYLRARYYLPTVGIFNRPDPFQGDPFAPQSLHKYAYANCNPIMNIDPSGQYFGFTLGQVLSVSAIIGALAGMVTYGVTGSLKAAIIVGVAAFILSFVALGGVGLSMAAITGGGAVTSPQLLNPKSWQEAQSMLGKLLELAKNSKRCFVNGMSTYRIPDFVDRTRLIADSKWLQGPLYRTEQLRDFVILAKAWDVPLYIYVRVGTHVPPDTIKLIEGTRGGVLKIFQ